eukprot:792644-Pelagomonas_calceolata.AAC.1
MRPASTRPTGLNWAKRGTGGEGGSVPTGRRLIVFIIGGAVRKSQNAEGKPKTQLYQEPGCEALKTGSG